jgi:SseB protein N-terminal domain
MIAKLLEWITGKDDLERVASRENLGRLNAYLKTRRVWIPIRPKRFLDADTFTQEQLLEQMEADAKELAGDDLEPWILDVDGEKRLPAFSSQKRMEAFSGKISKELNKVFSLGCFEILLEDLTSKVDIDYVDLNPFSKKSWEIAIRARRGGA